MNWKNNPELTRNFVDFIKEKSETGTYQVEVKVGDRTIPIDVFPTVFPPRSDYSVSSKSVFETFVFPITKNCRGIVRSRLSLACNVCVCDVAGL